MFKKRSGTSGSQGFTLIELLLVMAIFSIIVVMSSVFYSRFISQNAVGNTTDQLASSLRKAQLYAMEGRQNSNWGVTINSGKIYLFSGTSFATRTQSFDETYTLNGTVGVSGLNELIYTRVSGLPNNSTSITISANNNSDTITVNSQGVVSK